MYPVSEAFQQAVQENTRNFYWTGIIKAKEGKMYEFDASDILKGSGYISSQCCGSTEIEIGTVYSSELGITLFSQIDRYTLEDALISLSYHLRLPDKTYEEVPMGIFEISEANRTARCLEIKAYDYMLRFEKSFNGFNTIGTAYDFISLCCQACMVELFNDREEIEAMPNGCELLSIYSENDIESYRDVLYFVAQVLGGFFVINRTGKLEFKKYGATPVLEIKSKHRFLSRFSDFITRYTAVSSTNLRTQIAEYYSLETDDGLTMNLGVNPLLQFGLDETRRTLCTNILNDLSVISYIPFESDTIGNPAIDLGDIIIFSGGQADAEKITCVTSLQCKIGSKQILKCVGKNPRLAQAKSKNDKNITGLLNQIEAGKIGIHTFTNASSFSVADSNVKIISMEFAVSEKTHAQFFGQVIVDVSADAIEKDTYAMGNIVIPDTSGETDGQTISVELPVSWEEDGKASVQFVFELNDSIVEVHKPSETWNSGRHTILLYYPIEEMMANYTNKFNVFMKISGGTATVDTGYCIASISGQSMGADAAWDGKIDVEEFISHVKIGGGFATNQINENIGFEIKEIVKRQMADTIEGRYQLCGFAMPIEMN